jgi:hypothetical protein
VTNKNLTIKQISDVYENLDDGIAKKSITELTKRFFTEEEMIKYYKAFNPDDFKYNKHVYCSKETFTQLNKLWGRRFRWDADLINPEKILRRTTLQHITKESFHYIAEKTGVSTKDLLSYIQHVTIHDKTVNEFQEKLLKLVKFSKVFKD